MFYSKDAQEKEMSARIKARREAAALFPAIRKTAEMFDGKVLNCRFEKALKEAAGRCVFVEKRSQFVYIEMYDRGTVLTLATMKISEMADGKRINATALIEDAKQQRLSHLQKAADMERAFENAEVTRRQLNELKKLVEKVLADVPYEVRDVCNLNARLSF